MVTLNPKPYTTSYTHLKREPGSLQSVHEPGLVHITAGPRPSHLGIRRLGEGLGFRGLGFRGLGFSVWSLGFGVQDFGFKA